MKKIERIAEFDPLTGEILLEHARLEVFPATQFITDEDKVAAAIQDIEEELHERISLFQGT